MTYNAPAFQPTGLGHAPAGSTAYNAAASAAGFIGRMGTQRQTRNGVPAHPVSMSGRPPSGQQAPRQPSIRASCGALLRGLLAFACIVVTPGAGSLRAEPASARDAIDVDCVPHIRQAEAYLQIPQNLLLAISLVESAYQGYPYPWALNIGGQSHFATDFRSAAKLLRDEHGRPRRNVDVGCMQINMGSHLHRFSGNPELALVPKNNVWYGGSLLVELRQQSANWSQAVARYHTWTDLARQRSYLCNVIYMWNRLNRVGPTPATVAYCRSIIASR